LIKTAPGTVWDKSAPNMLWRSAGNVPDAKLHLQLANENLAKAKELMDKDNKRAASLIARASAEAELALAMSKSTMAKADAQEATDKLAKARGK
jgi:hypothetical protein